MHLKQKYSFGRLAQQAFFGLSVFTILIRAASAASLDTLLSSNLFEPYGVAVDLFNQYYITDSANNRILKYDPSTGGVTNLAGLKTTDGAGAVDGSGEFARFFSPEGIVALPSGLIVADTGNHVIRLVTYNGVVTTIAGDITHARAADAVGFKDGIGPAARFNTPVGLAVNPAGTAIYIADSQNNAIRKLDLATRRVTTITPPQALLRPSAVAVDDAGLIYVADSGNNSIKSFTEGSPLQLVAGSNSRFASGYRDAIVPSEALFDTPRGLLWVGGTTGLYVSDSGNHVIRRIFYNPDVGSNSVETVPATVGAGLVTPAGMAIDDNFDILIADVGANALRRIVSFLTPPPPVSDPIIGTAELVEDTSSGKTVTKVFPVVSGIFNNDVVVAIKTESGTETFYTKDGSDPSSKNGTPPPPIIDGKLPPSIIVPSEPGSQPDTTIKAISSAAGRRSSALVSARFIFQVANPSIDGNNPASFSLETATDNAQLWYTYGDSDETTPDPTNGPPAQLYVPSGSTNQPTQLNIILNRGNLTGTNVVFKVRGFKPGYLPSKIIKKTFVIDQTKNNLIGVPRDFNAGIGSTIVVPIALTLSSNNVIQSLQFRLEIAALAGGTGAPPVMQMLSLSGNDFIPIQFFTPDSSAIASYTNGVTNGLSLAFLGTNTAFQIPSSLTVAMVSVRIPPTAIVNQKYSISVLFPSATSDGVQHQIGLFPDVSRTITVTNISYRVGDVASATWYNAGDFGDGDLNNSDVNSVFLASLGISLPFPFTDVFDAMDAFPEDLPGIVGGDGQIRFLDWQVVLRRALRLSTNNWVRAWSPGGIRINSGGRLTGQPNSASEVLAASSAAIWTRQALIGAVPRQNVSAGSSVDIPVYVKVVPNCSLAGLSFRATVAPQGDAPAWNTRLQFLAAPGVNAPLQMFGDYSSGLLCGWSLGALSKPLGGSNLLGWIRFSVPATAQPGQSYKVGFRNADGAPDISTQYDLETLPGMIWIQSSALAAADVISPEWKTHFFGAVDAPEAADLADPDGDGISNRDEYLAGTDPTDAKSGLGLLTPQWQRGSGQIVLRWLTVAGKLYTVDLASDLKGPWHSALTDLIGDGALKAVTLPAASSSYQFYRVRLQP